MTDHHQYRLDIRFGDELLEAGFTSVPNLFLARYRYLAIPDPAAIWIIHLLRFKWTKEAPYPTQNGLPMTCNADTRRRYARELRRRGLLFTKRRHYTEETALEPAQVGKLQSLEYYLDSLFHNVLRVDQWLAAKKPLREFEIEIPAGIVRQVATGYFPDTPKAVRAACEQSVIKNPGNPLRLCPVCDSHILEKHILETHILENHIGNKEDSSLKEDSSSEEKEKAEAENNPASAATNPDPEIYTLLAGIGVQEPNLSILVAAHTTVQDTRAWLLYVQSQNMPSWRGYLVNRLKHRDPPPPEFLQFAALTDDQIDTLASSSRSRKWAGSWQQCYDTLDEAGITEDLAESWYQLCGKEEQHD